MQWLGQAETSWLTRDRLEEMGFSKMLTDIDMKVRGRRVDHCAGAPRARCPLAAPLSLPARRLLDHLLFPLPPPLPAPQEAAAAGLAGKPLTAKNVEEMLHNLGLPAEFATHSQIRGLSGGQKVKLVLGAAMWQQPHILVSGWQSPGVTMHPPLRHAACCTALL